MFERAREIKLAGSIPILADLTTLIGVGDIIAVGENSIAIVECKNRPSPSGTPSGRLARQKARGEQAARYLQSSFVDEGDKTRVAVAYDLPEPDYEQVALLLEASITSPHGIATHELGDRDVLLACAKDADRSALLSAIQSAMPQIEGDSAIAFAFLNELVESSSHRRPSPSNYPLPAELRWRLLEGDLQLIRIVDTSRLACTFSVDEIELHLVPRQGPTGLEVEVNSNALEHPVVVTSELAEICVWTPVSVERVKTAIIQHISSTLASLIDVDGDEAILHSHLAEGDDVTYVTRYRSEGGEVR
ncbi:hypothetical protein [Herbiconiux sp.]|uniref:hypothetical protein n=1 Tax=Herbiconiux sp. TaxID=1871186 RepID=UPI0025C09341|nr:hypothetical protein [Herbiconiux sp.]